MRRAARIAVALAASLVLTSGCPKPPPEREPPIDRTQQAAAELALAAWFECEECVDGELRAVLALGPLALPALTAALLDGPAPAARLRIEQELRVRHRELAAFASRTPGARFTIDQRDFVQTYGANHAARLQGRAAWALGEIDDPKAEHALRKALGAGLRADVQRGAEAALERSTRSR